MTSRHCVMQATAASAACGCCKTMSKSVGCMMQTCSQVMHAWLVWCKWGGSTSMSEDNFQISTAKCCAWTAGSNLTNNLLQLFQSQSASASASWGFMHLINRFDLKLEENATIKCKHAAMITDIGIWFSLHSRNKGCWNKLSNCCFSKSLLVAAICNCPRGNASWASSGNPWRSEATLWQTCSYDAVTASEKSSPSGSL